MRGNGSLFPLPLPYSFAMSRRTSVGMGYSHSVISRSLWSASASNILTRLASQSVTGHSPPIHVHQHYGLEFHLVLAGDSCIRRGCQSCRTMYTLSTQLERRLDGLCSCAFDEDCVPSDKVEQCERAAPPPDRFRSACACQLCCSSLHLDRWINKDKQGINYSQHDICKCKSNYVEMTYS